MRCSQVLTLRCLAAAIVMVCVAGTAWAGQKQRPKQKPQADQASGHSVKQKPPMPIQAQYTPIQAQHKRRYGKPPLQARPGRQSVPQTATGPARPASGRPHVPPRPYRPATSPVRRPVVSTPPSRPARYGRSTVTFDNQTSEPALVRLVGPTWAEVSVPAGGRNSAHRVAAGRYRIYVRYGWPGRFRYSEGQAFEVHETAMSYSHVTITLHLVPSGNYRIVPSTAAAFAAAGR